VKAVRQAWRDRRAADYAKCLDEEMAKLDLLEREVLPHARWGGPDGGVDMWAADRALRIMDRRARMLGLDSPSKVDATIKVELIARALEETLVELGLPTGGGPSRSLAAAA
jgi:hypothetical protein